MAKQKATKSAATRDKLIEDAQAKIKAAADALEAARADFEAAETAEDKAAAQTRIDAAGEDIKRYEKALEALLNPKKASEAAADDDDSAPTKRDFIVASPIKLDGEDYEEGDTISLDKATYDQLHPLGVIAGQD